jgi:hypothetical protein
MREEGAELVNVAGFSEEPLDKIPNGYMVWWIETKCRK